MYRRSSLKLSIPVLGMVALGPLRQAQAAELFWEVPEGCPTQQVVEERIEQALGVPLERAPKLQFYCRVTRAESSVRLELRAVTADTVSAEAARVFEATTCAQVADAAAVAITLALGAESTSQSSAPPAPAPADMPEPSAPQAAANEAQSLAVPQPSGAVTTTAKAPKDRAPRSTAPRSKSDPVRTWGTLEVSPSFDWGSLPRISPGIEGAFVFGLGNWALRLAGFALLPQQKMLENNTGGEFSLYGGRLALCRAGPRQRTSLRLCTGLELGQERGRGLGLLAPARSGTALWVTPLGELTVETAPLWQTVRYFVGLGAGVPLHRASFTVGGNTEVFRASPVVGRLVAGLKLDCW